jgi:catechol 2,3-dioxygenase-like lactoylglutathione lyase family enzyme
MIDHVSFKVGDIVESKAFFTQALAPLGFTLLMERPSATPGKIDVVGFGIAPKPEFFIGQGFAGNTPVHIAFRAENREQVREFYSAAMAAGGHDNGEPALCPEYHANYFAAFVLDPDGNNIEAVCHDPE